MPSNGLALLLLEFYNPWGTIMEVTDVPNHPKVPRCPNMRVLDSTTINCSICNKPVDLKTTKTDDEGQAVHEECYVLQQALNSATRKPGKVHDLARL